MIRTMAICPFGSRAGDNLERRAGGLAEGWGSLAVVHPEPASLATVLSPPLLRRGCLMVPVQKADGTLRGSIPPGAAAKGRHDVPHRPWMFGYSR